MTFPRRFAGEVAIGAEQRLSANPHRSEFPAITADLVRPRSIARSAGASHSRGVLRAAGPLFLLFLWFVVSKTGLVHPSVLPSPETVLATAIDMVRNEALLSQLAVSLQRSLTGAAIGISAGVIFGLIAGLWQLGEELIDSTFQFLRTIPFLALVPLFIVWMGIGETPKIALIALATMFPTYLYTYSGVHGVDPKVIEAMRMFDLGGAALIRQVVLPLALPSILTGVRFALGVSILVLIAAEQINAIAGLGYLLNDAQVNQRVDIILLCVLIYATFGLIADVTVRLLERLLLPWRPRKAAR